VKECQVLLYIILLITNQIFEGIIKFTGAATGAGSKAEAEAEAGAGAGAALKGGRAANWC
jgi:hypothetical protein